MQETLGGIIFYARSIWRYRWYAMAVTWLIVLLGWAVVSKKPVIYTASAKIHIDTSTVLQPLFKDSTGEQPFSVMISLMARQLVSRPNLEQVARTVGLDHQATMPQGFEAMLARLEKDITVTGNRASEGSKQRDFYTVSYSNTNPKLAKQVIEVLITTFIEKMVRENLLDSGTTKQSLDQEIKKHKEDLIAAETRLREFKRVHADDLPEQTHYFQHLQAAQAAVDEVELQITEAEFRRNELRRQLAQTATMPDSIPVADSRLLTLKKRLDELLVKYTENHPSVIATRRAIAELEKSQETITGEAKKGLTTPNSAHELLKGKLSEAESEIAVLWARKNEFLRRVQTLRKMKETLTKVETELQGLNQDYEAAKKKYDALIGRQNSATLVESIEQNGENVRLKVIDPPRILDTWPDKMRKQLLLTSGVLVAGIAGGLAVAFFLSQLWPVIYGQRDLQELTEFPVLGRISRANTSRMRRRFDLAAFILIGMAMLGIHGVAVFMTLNNIKSIMMQGLEKVG